MKLPYPIEVELQKIRSAGATKDYIQHKEAFCKALYQDKDITKVKSWDVYIIHLNHPNLLYNNCLDKDIQSKINIIIEDKKDSI